MGKPSIFSKEYQKRMKRRKRIVSTLIVLLIVAVAAVLVSTKMNFSTNIKNKVVAIFANKSSKDKVQKDKETASQLKNDKEKDNSKQSDALAKDDKKQDDSKDDKYIEVTLSSGAVSKAFYDEVSGTKKFKLLDPIDNGVSFDISPSQTSILINETNTQQIKVVDGSGQIKDVTKPNYTTKDGRAFARETILKQYQGYLWSVNAKFIDDSHVAYVSQLPWFGVPDLYSYIWVVDINTGEHKAVMTTKSKNLTITSLAADGLHVKADDGDKVIPIQQLIG
ncbi:hypothetical protein [Clostridium sp. C8-1-8]|uniref:hypothetical protein n=1 Tax=Clostridium sp. C8-1-8 TaxID=2698831 RepID=UPI001370CEF0|nr:hypothetical protein [Clostridium sp. C8-1-8]